MQKKYHFFLSFLNRFVLKKTADKFYKVFQYSCNKFMSSNSGCEKYLILLSKLSAPKKHNSLTCEPLSQNLLFKILMKKILFTFLLLTAVQFIAFSQTPDAAAKHWADSVFNTLNNDQRIALLMILRESSYTKDGPVYYDSAITDAIQKYNIG